MLIDNKIARYESDGCRWKTVWDFIYGCAGRKFGEGETEEKGRLDIVTGYFTIRALSKLYHDIPEEDTFRIVSSEMVKAEAEESHTIDILNGDLGIEPTLQLEEMARDAKAFLERNSVHVKAIVKAFCHAKVYLFRNNDKQRDNFYLTGSSNLTDAGLGLKESSNVEFNMGEVVKTTDNQYKEVCSWFDDVWEKMASETILSDPNDKKSSKVTVKEYFIRKIEEYFRQYTPEEIYYKILFELFNTDLEIDSSIEHRQDLSLLQTSVIWKTLFNYQQKGVISLIKMLRNHGGAILADAVGLGKTFSALAVIKYFQIQGYTTVVLCPKKLELNWKQYLRRTGSRFEKDEFDYEVRFHTDLQDDRLENNYDVTKLSYLQRHKKVLVVIDESHNLRNEFSKRYKYLLEELIQNKDAADLRDVKILMLSATPINTGLNDVKGQFKLIAHGRDNAFSNKTFGIESLDNLFKDSQKKYTQWCENKERTIGQFISKLQPKFFNLTDLLIVARTRDLIEKTLGENLGFPGKEKPVNIYQGLEHFGKYGSTDEFYEVFDKLHLAAYQPSGFMYESKEEAEHAASSLWKDNINRERFLVKMMCVLFMKRLESSWYSCLITISKVLEVHENTLKKVNDFLQKKSDAALDGYEIEDMDDEQEEFFSLRKGAIRLSEMKGIRKFKICLEHDVRLLREIYESLKEFDEKYRAGREKDEKLDELCRLIQEKQKRENRKLVIFTAYSDTAKFLFDELSKRGVTRMASVSGQQVCSTGHQKTSNFMEVLECFAPYSKLYKEREWSNLYEDARLDRSEYYDGEKMMWKVGYEKWRELVGMYDSRTKVLLDDTIDILIATDCLSEGQNLQDADLQVNYDIHWNPVRLIQRFGRIDRIGSPNKLIQCVNFWPAKSFEQYLRLEERIQDRMAIMELVGAETQEVNDKFKQMVEDNPLRDKNADRLLKELSENSISDIEKANALSLKDFSFEVYRQDMLEYFEKNKEVFRKMPCGIYSGFRAEDTLFEHIQESLVAVVGYPKREPGSTKPYDELYLMCQPVDQSQPAEYQELNRAEILNFLRTHKREQRYVPEWITTPDKDRLERLSGILRRWMQNQAPQQALVNIKSMLKNKKHTTPEKGRTSVLQEEKFQMENFDLIVWEYVSNSSSAIT